MSLTDAPIKLLVVDDDPIAMAIVKDNLHGHPFDLKEAHDWTSMSEVLFCDKPEVILLDVMLPGVNGDSIALIINETVRPRPKIVLHSSKEEAELRHMASVVGAVDYLSKGCSADNMVAALQTAGMEFRQAHHTGSGRAPSLPPGLAGSSAAARAPDARVAGRGVLLAAERTALRSIAQSKLVRLGISTTVAETWSEAIRELGNDKTGVMLIDADLEGISGIRLQRTIEHKTSLPPKVLLFSPVPPVEAQELAREVRASGVVSKETSPDVLVKILESALEDLKSGLS